MFIEERLDNRSSYKIWMFNVNGLLTFTPIHPSLHPLLEDAIKQKYKYIHTHLYTSKELI